jgi:hypothetical protein
MPRHEMAGFDVDNAMTGATAGARCALLGDIADGDVVVIEVPGHPAAKVVVRIAERPVFRGMLVMSASVLATLTQAVGGQVAAVTVRVLTRRERARRKVTSRHAAVVLGLLAAAVTLLVAFWPAPAGDARERIEVTAGWERGRTLSAADVRTLADVRRATARTGADAAAPWLKGAAAVFAFAAVAAATAAAWKTAES